MTNIDVTIKIKQNHAHINEIATKKSKGTH